MATASTIRVQVSGTEELTAQLTKVRQEMAKLMELLEGLEPPAVPPAKKTRART